MTCSLLPREIFRRHISKTRRAISLKFCMRNAFIDIMTHETFHFNRLMLALIFGIWASEPALGPGERLKRPALIGLSKTSKVFESLFQFMCQSFFIKQQKSLKICVDTTIFLTRFLYILSTTKTKRQRIANKVIK